MIAIVQARMSSQRFPGKTLYPLAGKPLLQYLLEKLEHCSLLSQIVIATSEDESDDPICRFCRQRGTSFVRGSLHDVAGRFMQTLSAYPCEAFIRVNGDSPLLDRQLIEKGISIFQEDNYDLVSNVLPRTFPKGQSVEVVRTSSFRDVYYLMKEKDEYEHVTHYFYNKSDQFQLGRFSAEKNYGDIQLSVDTHADMVITETLLASMTRPHWDYSWHEILQLYQKNTAATGPCHYV